MDAKAGEYRHSELPGLNVTISARYHTSSESRESYLTTGMLAYKHSSFFPPTHGSIMLPPRHPHVFAQLARCIYYYNYCYFCCWCYYYHYIKSAHSIADTIPFCGIFKCNIPFKIQCFNKTKRKYNILNTIKKTKLMCFAIILCP